MKDFIYTLDVFQAPEDEFICWCSKVTKGQILAAMEGGASTLADIKTLTGACRVAKCKELNPRGR